MRTHNLLPDRQSVYRAGHSSETAILCIQSDLIEAADSGKASLLALLNLSSAFGCVDYDILLQCLTCDFGLTQSVISWLKSYLTGRVQLAKCNSDNSTLFTLISGVPQGSVLGSLQFTLYTADLFSVIESHGLVGSGYSDDTQVYGSCK